MGLEKVRRKLDKSSFLLMGIDGVRMTKGKRLNIYLILKPLESDICFLDS